MVMLMVWLPGVVGGDTPMNALFDCEAKRNNDQLSARASCS